MPTLKKIHVFLTTLISLGCVQQGAMGYSPVEAAVQVPEALTVEEHPHQAFIEEGNSSNLPDRMGGESNFLSERLFQHHPQGRVLQFENGPRLHLKSPGKLPGIELGFEMHSLQAFQSVIPPENLPQGLNFKQEQPRLLRPSVNAPDYNGGFLRFTW